MAVRPVVNEWNGGLQWIANPDEFLQRASHAVMGDSGVWVIDPVDADGVDALLDGLGEVAGVVITVDRHSRDADEVAERHGVEVHLPIPLADLSDKLRAPTRAIDGFVEDTGFSVSTTVDVPGWDEVALFDDTDGTLIVGDALGTAPYFSPPGERLSVHPFLRVWPPRTQFAGMAPERVSVGHGEAVLTDGTAALETALRVARRRIPQAYINVFRHLPGPWTFIRRPF